MLSEVPKMRTDGKIFIEHSLKGVLMAAFQDIQISQFIWPVHSFIEHTNHELFFGTTIWLSKYNLYTTYKRLNWMKITYFKFWFLGCVTEGTLYKKRRFRPFLTENVWFGWNLSDEGRNLLDESRNLSESWNLLEFVRIQLGGPHLLTSDSG